MTSVGKCRRFSQGTAFCVSDVLSVLQSLHEVVFCNNSVALTWLIVKDRTEVFSAFCQGPIKGESQEQSIRLKRKRQKQQYFVLAVSVNSDQKIISESSPKYSVSMLKICVSLQIVLSLSTRLKNGLFFFHAPFHFLFLLWCLSSSIPTSLISFLPQYNFHIVRFVLPQQPLVYFDFCVVFSSNIFLHFVYFY